MRLLLTLTGSLVAVIVGWFWAGALMTEASVVPHWQTAVFGTFFIVATVLAVAIPITAVEMAERKE